MHHILREICIALTGNRAALVEVASLVAAQETGGLGLRSSTTGKFGVEVHDTFHASSILGSPDCLFQRSVKLGQMRWF